MLPTATVFIVFLMTLRSKIPNKNINHIAQLLHTKQGTKIEKLLQFYECKIPQLCQSFTEQDLLVGILLFNWRAGAIAIIAACNGAKLFPNP